MSGPRLRLLVLLLLLPVLAGCWSRREINDIGLVTTLGIDLADDGQLEVTVAIAQPGASGHGKGDTGAGRAKILLQRKGKTISEALRQIELASPRRLEMTHTEVIILGEHLALDHLDTYFDFLMRHPQIRYKGMILLLRGAPITDLLAPAPVMDAIHAQALQELQVIIGAETRLSDFFRARATTYRAPLIPIIRIHPASSSANDAPQQEPSLDGMAIFKGDLVALTLTQEQAQGVRWLQARVRDMVVTVPCDGDRFASFRVRGASEAISSYLRGGRPGFQVTLKASLRLVESQCSADLSDTNRLLQMTQQAEEQIRTKVLGVIDALQTAQVDPLEFGERVRVYHSRWWLQHGQASWPAVWAETPVSVEVQMKIEETGLTVSPATYRERP